MPSAFKTNKMENSFLDKICPCCGNPASGRYLEAPVNKEEELRDQFAGQALQGILSKYGMEYEELHIKKAWQIADAMLEERNKK